MAFEALQRQSRGSWKTLKTKHSVSVIYESERERESESGKYLVEEMRV